MKKFFKILVAVILIIIIGLVAFPFVYKDKINAYIKEEINNSVNAKVDYKDVSLSLFKDFPNLHVSINDISVDGIADFDSIRLANIGKFVMSLDFKKLFTDENLEIKKIKLKDADFNIVVLKNGKANYDIAKSSEEKNKENSKSFDLKLKEVSIDNLNLSYDDRSMNLLMKLRNFNQTGSGDFKQDSYLYNLNGQADTLDVIFDKIHYINNAKTDIKTGILIKNDFKSYIFDDLTMKLNDLDILSKMKFDLIDEDIEMDISYQTKDNSLKKILSLVPKAYLPDFNGLKTSGIAKLKGFVKGTYNDKNFPAYGVDFKITNGGMSYPDIPEKIKNINVVTKVDFAGGSNLDNTVINMPKIHFSVADNNVDGTLKINNPMSDPLINTAFKGKIVFNKLYKALKLSSNGIDKLQGILDANFNLKTRMSYVEKENYENVDASGVFHLNNFEISGDSIPYPVSISRANVNLSPASLRVTEFKSKINQSDFDLTGKLDNYLGYLLKKNKILKADFSLYSKKINLNDFMTDEEETQQKQDTSGFIKVPKNIIVNFEAQADEVLYKDMVLKDLSGNIDVKNEKVTLNTVLSKTFGGEMGLNGTYDTSKGKPVSSIKMNMKKVSIPEASTSLTTFSYYTPFMKKIKGQLFSNMQMQMELDNQMNPILSTLDLSGIMETANIKLVGIDILKKIAGLVKIKELDKAKIDKVKAQFEINKGNLQVKPFNFKLNGMKSEMSGKISLDKKMDFVLNIDIPKTKLGNNANKILENLVGKLSNFGLDAKLPDIIKMSFKIMGDYNNPKITPVIAGYEGQSVKDVVTQAVTDKANEVIDDTKQKAIAEAQAKADKLMKTAHEQADKLVGEAKLQGQKLIDESKKLGDKIRAEAKKQADELIKKAGNNVFKKLAAETTAKELIKQGDKKANRLENEAKNKAKQLETTAQNKANLILKNAQQKSNTLIEEAKKK